MLEAQNAEGPDNYFCCSPNKKICRIITTQHHIPRMGKEQQLQQQLSSHRKHKKGP